MIVGVGLAAVVPVVTAGDVPVEDVAAVVFCDVAAATEMTASDVAADVAAAEVAAADVISDDCPELVKSELVPKIGNVGAVVGVCVTSEAVVSFCHTVFKTTLPGTVTVTSARRTATAGAAAAVKNEL